MRLHQVVLDDFTLKYVAACIIVGLATKNDDFNETERDVLSWLREVNAAKPDLVLHAIQQIHEQLGPERLDANA